MAAGDQDEGSWAFGQQRPDLARITGVVQDQQGPLLFHAVSPVPDPFVQGGGQVPGVHPDCGQQHAQCLEGGCGVLIKCVAMQVHLQLRVGEAVLDQVGQVHGQRGLADPGHPVDGLYATVDGEHPTLPVRSLDEVEESLHFLMTSGEVGCVVVQRGVDLVRGQRQRLLRRQRPADRDRARALGVGVPGPVHVHRPGTCGGLRPADRLPASCGGRVPGVCDRHCRITGNSTTRGHITCRCRLVSGHGFGSGRR